MNKEAHNAVDAAITSRQSCRRFLDRPVSKSQLRHLLDVARFSPSGSNVQPWKVYAIGGEKKEALSREILEDYHANGERQDREYEYYPTDWFEPYLARRRACGWGLYGSLGITREHKDRMNEQRARNYIFFGAPVGLIFAINRRLNTGSWMDVGMFLQSVMVAARGQGLHTCAQASFANYPAIVRKHLGIPQQEIVVCGMAVGYGDMSAPENVWRTDRSEVEEFTCWAGLD